MRLALIVLGITLLLGLIPAAFGADASNRLPTKDEIREQFKLRAIRTIMEGLEYADFATQLGCPCYDVIISSETNVTEIKIDRENCEHTAENDSD